MTVSFEYQEFSRPSSVANTVYPERFIICLIVVSRVPPHQIGPT